MKKTQRLFVALLLSSSIAFVGCNRSSGGSNVSRATGWSINNKKGGFQFNTKYKGQQTAPGLVFIEGGSFTKGRVQDDIMHDWNNTPTQQNVQSFYMDETEVTNLMYLEYLDWLKRVFGAPDSPYRLIYEAALPDTLVWRSSLGFNEDMVKNYLRHPWKRMQQNYHLSFASLQKIQSTFTYCTAFKWSVFEFFDFIK